MWIQLDADGEIIRIVESNEGAEPGETWVERAVPFDYPLDSRWDAAELSFVPSIENRRRGLFAAVKALRDTAKDGGVEIEGIGRIETDPDSRMNINGAVQMASILGAQFAIDWRLSDNSVVAIDGPGMISIGVLVGQHVAACQYRKNELDQLITAAVTPEDLEAINIEAGWPGS